MSTRFAEAHRESVREYQERQNDVIVYPLTNLEKALFRGRVEDQKVHALVANIRQGKVEIPKELLVRDKSGQEFLNISVLEQPGMSDFAEARKISGMLELLRILDRDKTFSGEDSIEIRKFKEKRREVGDSVREEVTDYLQSYVDYEFELVDDQTNHSFESEHIREKYLEVQRFLQGIVERLFGAAEMKEFIPKVHLTRSSEVNAFVFTEKPDVSIQEFLNQGTVEDPLELPVFINIGLVESVGSPDEVAGVLAHEFSHLLQPAYIGSKAEDERQRLEYDADATGMKIADAAGFNPRGMVELMKKLAGDSSGNLLQKFGWGTHPDTNRRIIELEKLFHSSDHIFPNAEKKMEGYPANVKEAVDAIKNQPRKKVKDLPLREFENDNILEETLRSESGYEVFFSSSNFGRLLEIGNRRLHDEIVKQELAHGTLGHRQVLLDNIKTFILALDLQNNKREDDPRKYTVLSETARNNSLDHLSELNVKELDLAELEISQEKKYLAKNESENKYALSKEALEFERKKNDDARKKISNLIKTSRAVRCDSLEDLLDPTNEDAQLFWKGQVENGETLTQSQKLFLFKKMLMTFMSQQIGYSRPFFEVFYENEEQEILNVTLPKDVEKGVLSKIPVGLRAQRKDEIADKRTHQVERKTTKREDMFSASPQPVDPRYQMWALRPKDQPPLLQELTQLVQEKTVDAYQQILQEDGMENVRPDVLHFLLRKLQIEGMSPLFEINQSHSIDFISAAIDVLERKKLSKIFEGNLMIPQREIKKLSQQLLLIAAFCLKPTTPQEEILQANFRRRVELDPTAVEADHSKMVLYRGSNIKIDNLNEKYITVHSKVGLNQDEIAVEANINYAKTLATVERIWQENRQRVLTLFESEEPLQYAGAPLEFRTFEASTTDFSKVENELCKVLDKKIGKLNAEESKLVTDLVNFAVVARKFQSYIYREELLTNEAIDKMFEKEKYHSYPALEYYLEEVAAQLFDKFKDTIDRKKITLKSVEDYKNLLKLVLTHTDTIDEYIIHLAEVNAIQGDPSVEKMFQDEQAASTRDDRDVWYLFRPSNLPFLGERASDYRKIKHDTVLTYVEQLAQQNPSAKKLYEALKQLQKKKNLSYIPQGLRLACIGQLGAFSLSEGNDLPVAEVISLWRLAKDVYQEEWRNIEQFKRFDEQMSHWEWLYNNPFESLRPSKKQKKETSFVDKMKNKGILLTIESDKDFTLFLKRIYKIDTNNVTNISFSWPLFISDVWSGVDIAEKMSDSEQRQNLRTAIEALREELKQIVEDKDTWKIIEKMQPGFFREFLVAKKLEKMSTLSLDELEKYLPYFEARAHEGSERNQISILLEVEKQKVKKDKVQELFERACREVGISNPKEKNLKIERKLGSDYSSYSSALLSDRDIYIVYTGSSLQSDGVDLKLINQKYFELLAEDEKKNQEHLPMEDEVFVFSDQIIENEKSKLEIGPTYRLRFASQPLMDWHKNILENSGNLQEAEGAFKRIERIFPEKHPLRDVFVKNQLAHEIWQLLTDNIDVSELREIGVHFVSKTVNLRDALQNFPLYHEVAFLKNYTLYEVQGLASAIDKLPKNVTQDILQRIEKVFLERISPDQAPAIRRILFNMEKKLVWDDLRKANREGENVFDSTLERILSFYKEPTFERDQILLDIGMDLATTPEQIRYVWSLTRNEQMRWPDEREKASKRAQHETFEKVRGMLSTLSTTDRSQYILWMLGGDAPLAEKFSAEKTGVSLLGRRDMFWQMTANERRELLYDMLLRENGVFEPLNLDSYYVRVKDESPGDHALTYSSSGFARAERPYDMVRYFANNLFEHTFGEQLLDPAKDAGDSINVKGKEMMQIIFRGMFVKQPESARRAELLINIVEAVGSAKQEKRDLSPGELIKLLLEQIGVVGIKAAQVLSEQPGLLPESIRKHLAELKDSGKKVSKQVPATYLQSTGWLSKTEGLHCTSIQEEVGVASIKQVNRAVLSDNSEVAVKFKRPSIDKNFEQDLGVLREILNSLNEKGFDIPDYLLNEIEKAVRDELSFTHEVDHQIAMKRSLEERQAKIDLPIGKEASVIPLLVTSPLRIPDILYPSPESEEDLGLIVEQYVRGLSLKDIQKYQQAIRENDTSVVQKMRERVIRLYDNSRVKEIETKVATMDTDRFQANLGLELLREVVQGGAFHADLHSGNIFIDFTPFMEDGEFFQAKAVLIDLGSTGYSEKEKMPNFLKEKTADSFEAKEDFRDFLTALFAPQIRTDKVAEIVNKYGGTNWDAEQVGLIIKGVEDTSAKVKKIFYSILEEGKAMDDQFRYFLKAVATGAGHLDKLREVVQSEINEGGEDEESMILPKLVNEGLLNIDLMFAFD